MISPVKEISMMQLDANGQHACMYAPATAGVYYLLCCTTCGYVGYKIQEKGPTKRKKTKTLPCS